MDFVEILEHHLLDHRIKYLLNLGGKPVYLTTHGLMMVIAGVLLILMGAVIRRRPARVPTGMANAVEAFVVYIRDEIVRPAE